MPLYRSRRYRGRRPTMRRARLLRRRRIYRKRGLKKRQPIHVFKRACQDVVNLSSGSNTLEYSFALNAVQNYSEFTDLFDQYKINAVRLEFIPTFNSVDPSSSRNSNLYSVIDRTDNSSVSSVANALEYMSVRHTPFTRRHVRYFKPSVLVNVMDDTSTDTGAYQPKINQWIACDFPTIKHYGIKLITDTTSASNTTFNVLTTYYLSFKNVH